jgi:hypothetical protein
MEPPRKSLDEAANHPEVERIGDTLVVTTLLSQRKDDTSYFHEFGMLVWRTARAIQLGAPDIPADVTTIRFKSLRLDPSNDGAPVPFIDASVDVGELRRSKPTAVGEYEMMNFASNIVIASRWMPAEGKFCKDSLHKDAETFCRNARSDGGLDTWEATTSTPPITAAPAHAAPAHDYEPTLRRIAIGMRLLADILRAFSRLRHH